MTLALLQIEGRTSSKPLPQDSTNGSSRVTLAVSVTKTA